MELNVFERLLVRNIIPQIQGWNFGHMKEARKLVEDLFTPEEEEKLQITLGEDGKQITWKTQDADGNEIPQVREIEISEGLSKKIKKLLEQLDRENKLEMAHYSLCEKFEIG
jgi:RNA polymerase-binding transcription factor DksA